eukprot:TRINITY_DN72698_c0_g1_i1.p1 TRINITY_DN72698_c0_g1~~TRINITY_DN72698_c0_g1_i1.p1  ORF type:complete len:411 (+),score=18.55 TRINITY_DN72698_c0_g1_i1:524-1756(+)
MQRNQNQNFLKSKAPLFNYKVILVVVKVSQLIIWVQPLRKKKMNAQSPDRSIQAKAMCQVLHLLSLSKVNLILNCIVGRVPNASNFYQPPNKPFNKIINSSLIYYWNVDRVCQKEDERKNILNTLIETKSPEIICLEETKLHKGNFYDNEQYNWAFLQEYYQFWNFGDKLSNGGHSGTAIFTKTRPKGVEFGMGIPEYDKDGRTITLEFDSFIIVVAYVPNSGADKKVKDLIKKGKIKSKEDLKGGEIAPGVEYRKSWDRAFNNYLKSLIISTKKCVIIGGDMNVALVNPEQEPKEYKPGFTQEERDGFKALLDIGFIDTCPIKSLREGRQPTTHSENRDCNVLDYILILEQYKDAAKDFYVDKVIQSPSHYAIAITLDKVNLGESMNKVNMKQKALRQYLLTQSTLMIQ